jgi:hypothetical protein
MSLVKCIDSRAHEADSITKHVARPCKAWLYILSERVIKIATLCRLTLFLDSSLLPLCTLNFNFIKVDSCLGGMEWGHQIQTL